MVRWELDLPAHGPPSIALHNPSEHRLHAAFLKLCQERARLESACRACSGARKCSADVERRYRSASRHSHTALLASLAPGLVHQATTLEQLKACTTVVADTGDFNSACPPTRHPIFRVACQATGFLHTCLLNRQAISAQKKLHVS